MKISGQGPVNWNKTIQAYNKLGKVDKGNSRGQDTLHISAGGQIIQEIKALAAKDDDIRVDLVEAIRSRLEAGTYNVSVDDTAEAIIKEMNL